MEQNRIKEFVKKYDPFLTRYEAYYYGYPEIADELCRLVLRGEKKATTGLLKSYLLEGEELPREGDYSVILDSREQPRCITRISRVTQVRFSDITEEYARTEGEGDKSLAYWKEAHRQAFGRECREEYGIEFTEDMICVCEEFEVVYAEPFIEEEPSMEEELSTEKAAVIDTMKPEDYEEVRKLWVDTPGMGLNETDDSEEGITAYLKRNPSTCFVARKEGRMVGAILSGHDGRRGFIYHTAVKQTERKQGIGSALVDAALTGLKREGIKKVALVVFRKNQTGDAFWEKQGFALREDLNYRNKALAELVRIDT